MPLVRANYRNINKDIEYSPIYLVRFFRNLLLKDSWVLKNRYLHIRPTDDWKEQPNLNSQIGSGQKNNFINKEGEENVPSSSQDCSKFVPSSPQVEELIIRINKDYLSIGDIMNLFGLKNRTRFRKDYITPALARRSLGDEIPKYPKTSTPAISDDRAGKDLERMEREKGINNIIIKIENKNK